MDEEEEEDECLEETSEEAAVLHKMKVDLNDEVEQRAPENGYTTALDLGSCSSHSVILSTQGIQ